MIYAIHISKYIRLDTNATLEIQMAPLKEEIYRIRICRNGVYTNSLPSKRTDCLIKPIHRLSIQQLLGDQHVGFQP